MVRYVFGAGKIGKQIIEFLQKIQLSVVGIFDNDEEKWGTEVSEVTVIKFEKQYLKKEDSLVYVACADYWDVVTQLKKEDIPDKKIIVADSIYSNSFLSNIACHMISVIMRQIPNTIPRLDVLLDLSGGMVLGGVEQWNYELAAKLREKKIKASYFVVTRDDNKPENTTYPSINVNEEADIACYIKKIMEVGPKVIVCNFPFCTMKAACMIKRCYDKDLKIIAIIHNDLDLYYRTYDFWKKEIDLCIGISEKIENKVKLNRHMADKFIRFHWKTDIPLVGAYRYSNNNEPIRLGYAGRIVEHQKRLDRMIPIAKDLVKKNIDFRIQLAGDGTYRAEFEDIIFKNNLQMYFQFLGRLEHNQMQEFWENQDIYLNCSDYEGHSIAQAEAMASGAVPVMMDVSGAQDDIINGENGFVVPIGDTQMIAEKIDWLYRNRSLLPIMGDKSRKKVEANNKLADNDLKMLMDEITKVIV